MSNRFGSLKLIESKILIGLMSPYAPLSFAVQNKTATVSFSNLLPPQDHIKKN
jgi:hypothetical protein